MCSSAEAKGRGERPADQSNRRWEMGIDLILNGRSVSEGNGGRPPARRTNKKADFFFGGPRIPNLQRTGQNRTHLVVGCVPFQRV